MRLRLPRRHGSANVGVRAADVVGVPVLPPARVAAAVEQTRAAIGRVHRALVPPPVRILDAMLAPLDAAVLGAICSLGLPDQLRRGVALAPLAEQLEVDVDRLTRLVRFAHTRGWVRLDRRGRVHPTRVTRFLRRRHPGGWAGWVDFASSADVLGALAVLGRDPRVLDPFAAANGAPFFEWCATHPERQVAFDAAMSAGGRMHGLALARVLDWSDTRRVCDVGGGSGELLRVLLGAHPRLEGVVTEIPSVAVRIEPTERLTVRAADAFEFAEPGCDRYLFVNVLHDWSDDDAVRLLATVRRSAPESSEVVVVESERRPRPA
ncbi:MAG TPA: methyltransferase, partial [Acidimicrobiia bacterium]|nr:methyltransferase [Acidimicrobiia bacterium]